jgi:hypothetical protein
VLVATTSHPSRRPPRRDHVPSVGVNRAAGAPAFARAAFPPALAVGSFPGVLASVFGVRVSVESLAIFSASAVSTRSRVRLARSVLRLCAA